MKPLVALVGLLWAAAHLLVAYLFVTNAFVAKTAQKEGVPAQMALLVGGGIIAVFALALVWQSIKLAAARNPAASEPSAHK